MSEKKDAAEFEPWVEKYRPRKLRDVVGHEAVTERLQAYVDSKNLPHVLLAGPPGTGKTACALALAHELFGEAFQQSFLELNGSDERGIDVIRGKIKDFARTLALASVPFKIIFLDEADAMTDDAQHALRRTMERFAANTRFILSCNYSSRLIEPIQSRCAVFRFSRMTLDELGRVVERVARGEGLKMDEKAVNAVLYVSGGDARKAINVLQGAAAGGGKLAEDDIFKVASRARPAEVEKMVSLAWTGRFAESRSLLDDLMIKYGMSGEDVVGQVFREIANLSIPDKQKVALVDKVGEYEFRMTEGANERIQLEALLAQIQLLGQTKT